MHHNLKIAVIGLGYVGLPLAVEFSTCYPVIGFDTNPARIHELQGGRDSTKELSSAELLRAKQLSFSSDPSDLAQATVYIITVPTPIDKNKKPDLSPLQRASETVAAQLQAGDTVIYESTVYPGATEEECVPILEQISGLRFNHDFSVGYSPERVNPGDKKHRVTTIKKVTSGSTPETADFVDKLYSKIITAGTHQASSIKVAEAAKVIENTQRDVNIALVNELALIFNRMDIDTEEVLQAAGTKWNFLHFRPGLVGGHCIGVDPYYLTHKAQELGYHPDMILAGRRINDSMGEYVASQLVKAMLKKRCPMAQARVLVMGLSFKEDCPDIRNSRVIDIIQELESFGIGVDVYDPWVVSEQATAVYGVTPINEVQANSYDGIIIAVAHSCFKEMGATTIRGFGKKKHVLYDIKSTFSAAQSDQRL